MTLLSQDHKDLGVVYTPRILVEFICKTTIHTFILDHLNRKSKIQGILVFTDLPPETYDKALTLLEGIRILDPAVGVGFFLQTSFDVLLKLHLSLIELGVQKKPVNQIRLEIVKNNLFGVDISEKAVKLCRENLARLAYDNNKEIDAQKVVSNLKLHVKIGNTLIGRSFLGEKPPPIQHFPMFNWPEEFPDIAQGLGFTVCVGNPPWNILKPLEKEFFSQYDPNLSKYRVDKQEAQKIIERLKSDRTIYPKWINYESNIKKQSEYYRKYYRFQSGLIQVGRDTRRVSGDLNLYKLFLERIFFLLTENGVCGIILPSGIHSDAGTKGLRKLIFEENEVTVLYSFENRQGIFPSIHKSFKFDILIFRKNQTKTTNFQTTFMQRNPEFLNQDQCETLTVSWEKIKRFSPSAWSIIEFKNNFDIKITEKMYQYPVLTESTSGFSKIVFSRELDVTIDSHLFNADSKGLPIYEGKMIEQFTHRYKKPRYWIEKSELKKKYHNDYLEYRQVRIGFRAIAASTNRRTMIATLIPANSCCSNSILYVKNFNKSNQKLMRISELLYLLGIFNSFVFDYLLRLKVSQNLNMYIIRDMPLPRNKKGDTYSEIVALVRAIYCEVPEISRDITSEEMKFSEITYSQKRAFLDALVARTYNLTYRELEYILDQFQISDNKKNSDLESQKRKILSYFKEIQF
ncbi:MAG: Eco57I restriction-modification methylase domain-containing protein [Candidatus Hodarchaeales archaeon]|jgi:Alw26I/Eco31I/Esp3I family type II restriction m6 adenine DNA methyltransferase